MNTLRGLYAITLDPSPGATRLNEQVAQAIAGGAKVIQYREKSGDRRRRRDEAEALLALCRSAGVPLIINDDVALAAQIGADGVHIGREDGALAHARATLGAQALVGVSCYNDLDLALTAQDGGASYIAFGSFHPSPTKPQAVRAAPQLLQSARQQIRLPVVAIGGITPQNGPALIHAGADMLAVISGVFEQSDITRAAHTFSSLFSEDNLT